MSYAVDGRQYGGFRVRVDVIVFYTSDVLLLLLLLRSVSYGFAVRVAPLRPLYRFRRETDEPENETLKNNVIRARRPAVRTTFSRSDFGRPTPGPGRNAYVVGPEYGRECDSRVWPRRPVVILSFAPSEQRFLHNVITSRLACVLTRGSVFRA